MEEIAKEWRMAVNNFHYHITEFTNLCETKSFGANTFKITKGFCTLITKEVNYLKSLKDCMQSGTFKYGAWEGWLNQRASIHPLPAFLNKFKIKSSIYWKQIKKLIEKCSYDRSYTYGYSKIKTMLCLMEKQLESIRSTLKSIQTT